MSMNGTTGLASCRTTGPTHTTATSAATVHEPTERTASRQPGTPTSGQSLGRRRGTQAAAMSTTSIAIRIGARNRPKPASVPSSRLSLRTAPTIATTSASVTESNGDRRTARARTMPAPSSRPLAKRTSTAAGSVTASCPSTPSTAAPGSNPTLSEAWSQVSPRTNAANPATPMRSSVVDSRSRTVRGSTAGMVRVPCDPAGGNDLEVARHRHEDRSADDQRLLSEPSGGNGAGGGSRTRDLQFGKLTLLPTELRPLASSRYPTLGRYRRCAAVRCQPHERRRAAADLPALRGQRGARGQVLRELRSGPGRSLNG